MPYNPLANPYIMNPKELPSNQTAAAAVPAANVGTANQWSQSPYSTPNWAAQYPPTTPPTVGAPWGAQAISPVATAAVTWPDAIIADRDVGANANLNAEKTRQTTAQTNAANAITALNAVLTGSPGVAQISPSLWAHGVAQAVTIQGSNFTGTTGVTIGGVAATGVTIVNDGEITCTAAVTTPTGLGSVAVTNASGTGTLTNAVTVTPYVTGVSPATGSHLTTTPVVITGIGLTGTTGVNFGATAATAVVVVSDTQVTCTAPTQAAAGAQNVVLTNPAGSYTLTGGFVYS